MTWKLRHWPFTVVLLLFSQQLLCFQCVPVGFDYFLRCREILNIQDGGS